MNEGYTSILNDISSKSPTPGGGAVAALCLAHAYSLTSMVANLTIGREKWLSGQEISNQIISNHGSNLNRSLELAKNDSNAFEQLMEAYRLPKNSEKEILTRKDTITNATLKATNIPFETAEQSLELLKIIPKLLSVCNQNAITDAAGAAEICYASIRLAILNVEINIGGLIESEKNHYSTETELIIKSAEQIIGNVRDIMKNKLE
ncbi:MAG: cyclodeaminase/cyclohydrolase family protein [Euryarchaeota archaeon]|jgi:formiminotetrahydrofolate cyclodeaminase|nr:cyclodeaminase/cyclohydrolase family protein [Euryarchaeota archaeon]MBT5994268.1 cyclodeaminase/cyclohydrolase family protein [Candidatus Neomarinimicrobiota bacterium]MBT3757514.1 cyclodeaminase/cyclohydrolase family protein [Euryarchaeota archaeon]MBT4050606.1 cyclodeaminase/cyclohydrolase family protein [Euryarchaeota archaeon]MBT4650738.1 cyclodeaminase/cyclohydrolase family protein [Euryarchaeota archaeon]|tara:strand:- start:4821 stop:5438 length:618 start_codon:yes stop_codon:yes gene_type:complete